MERKRVREKRRRGEERRRRGEEEVEEELQLAPTTMCYHMLILRSRLALLGVLGLHHNGLLIDLEVGQRDDVGLGLH